MITNNLHKCYAKTKAQNSFAFTAKLISAFVFATLYTDSTIHLFLTSKISSFKPSSVTEHAGLCQTWSKTQAFGFLMRVLII